MKETDIVQALRCCAEGECKDCAMHEDKQRCQENLLDKAAEAIERLTAENAALREKVPRWISVEDRLPIDRLSKYLVAFRDAGGSIVDMARYFPSDGWTCDNWEVPQNLITHWMPLPEAPDIRTVCTDEDNLCM